MNNNLRHNFVYTNFRHNLCPFFVYTNSCDNSLSLSLALFLFPLSLGILDRPLFTLYFAVREILLGIKGGIMSFSRSSPFHSLFSQSFSLSYLMDIFVLYTYIKKNMPFWCSTRYQSLEICLEGFWIYCYASNLHH